jgi:tetratricopeptide (TPR) repeat protein
LERAKACFHTGRILRYQHKYPEALDAFKSGLVYVRESRSAHWEANLHDALGDVYLLQNQLDEARREYRDFLACDPKGPGLRDRAKYQQAKLALSEAMAEPPGPGQQQMLHKVRKACAELAHGPGFEMLPSKARLIESQALMAGRNFPLAAEVSQKAAQSFREHSAWWYAAEAMLSTGEAYLAAGEMAQAARVFLAGLQSTVDDLQRQRFLDQIRLKSSMLDPQEVCACLAELLDQNRQLADARDACRRTEDGLRNLMRTMKFPLAVGVGSVAHLQDVAIQLAEQFPKNQCALKAVEETRAHAELLECQVQLAECWQTRLCTPRWISFAEIVGAASPPLPKVQVSRLARRRHLGIFADPELVAHALGDCAEMVRQWVGLARASCAYVEAEQHLVVRFFGTPRAWQPVSSKLNELIQEVPPPATLRSCRLKPQCWARLNWAAIRLRSIGGTVRFSLEARASDRPQRNCCLEVRLPCDEVPLWHADFNPNPVKEA